ncbi:MAG: hypothetical protein GWM98_17520, partial [Nitrospinaceae bacterium]|nr:hypothetical protein [Nitrospinaceae bacterium]
PATIFNGMVNPVIPYAIKGTIWYQGEANSGYNPHRYGRNFRAMISSWRRHWGQGDFPFYFAQLANYGSPKASSEGWPTVCDQQRRTLGLKNTGMAVLYDIGESRDVHPHNKMDVGRRLALWALKHDYPSAERRGGGKAASIVCSGPLYRSHSITDGKVVVLFDHAGSGLMTGEKPVMDAARETGEPLRFFEICGADRQWKQAQAEITGKDTVTVTHPEVPEPVSVRYGWSKNPEGANLYNKEGLPASIFTTESEVPAAGTPQVVNANMKVPAMMENPPKTWLTYHLAHPGPDRAWPGDPNPAFFWKGRYHLHYIYRDPTGFVFAHVSSDDMVHWKWHPTVLGPTTMGHGMFSGTGFFTKDGRPAMVYHGQRSNRNWIAY